MSKQEQLQQIFLLAREKKDKKKGLTLNQEKDILEITQLLADTMEELGLTISPVTALELNKDAL